MAQGASDFLKLAPLTWEQAASPLFNTTIAPYKPLFTRMDSNDIDKMVEASRETTHAQPEQQAWKDGWPVVREIP